MRIILPSIVIVVLIQLQSPGSIAHPSMVERNAKVAATASRLTGVYLGLGIPLTGNIRNRDSTSYTYSGNRGGDLENRLTPDIRTTFAWDTSSLNWKPTYRDSLRYNAANYDTLKVYQKMLGSTWVNTARGRIWYNTARQDSLTTYDTFSQGAAAYIPASQTRSLYDTKGNRIDHYWNYWSAATMSYSVPNYHIAWTYNSAGKMLSETREFYNSSTNVWTNFSRYLYTYDASNNLSYYTYHTWNTTTNMWANGNRELYSYDGPGNLTSIVGQKEMGTGWENYDSTGYKYDAAGNDTFSIYSFWNTGIWDPFRRSTSTYTTSNQLSTVFIEENPTFNGTWANYQRFYYFYNSFNQEVREYRQDWNSAAWGTAYEARFHYETYDNSATVKAGPPKIDLLVYPIPADASVTVNVPLARPASLSGVVTDATGRVVLQWQAESNGAYVKSIPTGNLASGIYHLTIHTGGSQVTRKFVVQH